MILLTIFSVISFIFIVFLLPGLIIFALAPLYISAPLAFVWAVCAIVWWWNSSEWILQAYHAKPLSVGKRIHSLISLENFFDAKSYSKMPKIYLQDYSEVNPFLIFARSGKYNFLISREFYELLSDDHFSSLLSLSQQRMLILPFWVNGKMLALKLLFLQFFSSLYYQVRKLKGKYLKTMARYFALTLCYISAPLFVLSGKLYSKTWELLMRSAFERGELSQEVWERLESILVEENQMSLLGYLIGTGHGEVRAHPLVNL